MRRLWEFVCATLLPAVFACGNEGPIPSSPPDIQMQPSSLTLTSCSAASFSVRADGAAPLRYQWFEAGKPVAGASGSSYDLGRVGPLDSGRRFSVAVTNVAGTTMSDEVTLAVADPPSGQVVLAAGAVFGLASDGNAVWACCGRDRDRQGVLAESLGWHPVCFAEWRSSQHARES